MYDFQVPAAVVRGLAQTRRITVAVRSPLYRYATDGGRAASMLLDEPQLAAISLIANPAALVRVRALSPSEPEPSAFAQFVRDDHVCGFAHDGETLHLGLRRPLAELASDLAHAATYSGPLLGQHYQLWPSIIETLSALWRASGSGSALVPADLDDVFPDRTVDERRVVLDQLTERGALVADGDAYAIRPLIRPWLDLLWSGHELQLEHLRLRFGVPFDDALAQIGDTLLFVGPEGQRVRSHRVTGADLAAISGGAPPPEAEMIRLSAPPPDKLEATIARVLRVRA